MMFCAEPEGVMDQEAQYLAALETAATYTISADRLELRTADGALAVSYVAAGEATAAAPAETGDDTRAPDAEPVDEATMVALRNMTYTNIAVPLAPGDRVYMTTDGLTDQVGGPNRRMFGKRRFRELLAELADRTMKDQKKEILTAFRDFQGQENRRDDLSLIGFRLD